MKQDEEKRALLLPARLYDQIEERVKGTEFSSVDEYVIFVMEEVLKEEGQEKESALSDEEEEEVKKRLRDLGYLD
jgi:Arc/MetJ-type ribon-helix-helix transcriptional regulator